MENRNTGLDLMRGIAAIAVTLYHFLYWKYGITILSMGTFTVYIFFILSAVTLQMVYSEKFSRSIELKTLQNFYRNRFARIIPLLAIISVVGFAAADQTWNSFIRMIFTATGAFSFHMPGYLSGSAGAWSLGIEIIFYALFPIICLLSNNLKIKSLAGVCLFFLVLQQLILVLLAREYEIGSLDWWKSFVLPITFSPFFLVGIMIQRLPKAATEREGFSRLILALLLFAFICIFSAVTNTDPWENNITFLFLEALACASVALIYTSKLPTVITALGDFLGKISYALYLTHWYVYKAVTSIGDFGHFTILIVLPAQILLAYGVYIFFENPLRKKLRATRSGTVAANQ